FLFESVVAGERLGRYSFVGSGPFLRFTAHGTKVQVRGTQTLDVEHPDPLRLLEELLGQYRAPAVPGLPRFTGGAVGYAGYDVIRYSERLPNPPQDDRGLPDLCFAFFDRMVLFDHITKTIAAVAHAHVGPDLKASYKSACERVDRLVERLHQGVADLQLTDIDTSGEPRQAFTSNFTREEYEAAVEKCKEYIRAGDI